MKLSNTWFALTLIASVSLLSAARNASGEPHSRIHTSKIEAGSRKDIAGSEPVAPPIDQSAAEKSNARSGGETYNYNGTFKYVAPANPPESGLRQLGDVATVLSTIAVAVFTFMLWYVSNRQK